MHENIAKANHPDEHRRMLLCKEPLPLQSADAFTAVGLSYQPIARADMVSYVHHRLDRSLKAIFCGIQSGSIAQKRFKPASALRFELL